MLSEIDGLPPGPDRWAVKISAELLAGQVLRDSGQVPEMKEAFRRVLRLQTDFQLDPDYYATSVREDFDRVRREVVAQKKGWLSVLSQPIGAKVYVDGKEVGRTLFSGYFIPGTYRVQVGDDNGPSLHHLVVLRDEGRVGIDLDFDRRISTSNPVCIASGSTDEIAYLAERYGRLLGVPSVIVVSRVRAALQMSVRRINVTDSKTSASLDVDAEKPDLPSILAFLSSAGSLPKHPISASRGDGP